MKKEMKRRMILSVMTFCTLLFMNGFYCQAAANYGEAAGTWILDQLFWVGLVGLAIGLVGCLLKKAWVAALITGFAGSFILFFMKSPDLIKSIGENIVNAVFQ